MNETREYSIEWFREIYRDNPKWLGTQARKLWEHYVELETKLEEARELVVALEECGLVITLEELPKE